MSAGNPNTDVPFIGAIAKTRGVSYLGDSQEVRELLGSFLARSIERWSSDEPHSDPEIERLSKEDGDEIDDLVATFLGEDDDFLPVVPWNSPGHIDVWLKSKMPRIDETDAHAVVEVAVRMFVFDAWQVIKDWTAVGSSDVDCQNALTLVINRWSEVFMGIDGDAIESLESEVVDPSDLDDSSLLKLYDPQPENGDGEVGATMAPTQNRLDQPQNSAVIPRKEGEASAVRKKTQRGLWDEEDERKHPRDHGRFASKGGGGSGPRKNPNYEDAFADVDEKDGGRDNWDDWGGMPPPIRGAEEWVGGGSKGGVKNAVYNRTPDEKRADDLPSHPAMEGLRERHPDVADLYGKDSDTEAGTIHQHTKVVLHNFEKQISPEELSAIGSRWNGDVAKVVSTALALHDIGKPIAIAKGDKRHQHEETSPVLMDVMKREGFNDREIALANELVNHDLLGEAVKRKVEYKPGVASSQPVDMVAEIVAKAKAVGMEPADFAKLQLAVYHADAGAYSFVRQAYMKDEGGKLSLKNNGPLQALTDVADGKPIPPPRPATPPAIKQWFGQSKVVDDAGNPLVVYHGTHGNRFDEFSDKASNAWSQTLGFPTYFHTDGIATANTYANQFDDGHVRKDYVKIEKPLVIDANGGEWVDALSEATDKIKTYRTPEEKAFLDFKAKFEDQYGYEMENAPDEIPPAAMKELEDRQRAMDRHVVDNPKLYKNAARKPYGYDGIIVKNVLDMTSADTGEVASYNPYATVYISFDPKQIKSAESAPKPTADSVASGGSSAASKPEPKPEPKPKQEPAGKSEPIPKDLWGTEDPYVYHATSARIPLSKFADGILPSKDGHGGPGVYMANAIEGTHDHVGPEEAMYFRISKQGLSDRFGRYPANKSGVEFDDSNGELLLGGKRRIPPQLLEVKIGDQWLPLEEALKRPAKKKSFGLERYSVASILKSFDESKVRRARDGEFAPKGGGSGGSGGGHGRSGDSSRSPKSKPDSGGHGASGGKSAGRGLAVAVRVGKEWRLSNGKPLPAHVPRNIPPAWTGVQVSTDPKSALVARGIDKKGRVQSVYSDAHAMKQAAVKFARVNELRRKADAIRKEITADLKSDDPATREGAAVLSLIEHAGLRPGSDADTGAEKQAYGATTLEGRHVVKTADGVRLRFVGKKGKDLDIPITDPAIAKLLLDRKAAAGNKGRLFNIDDAALRDYTHSKDGGSFKPKDFRTARGTSIAADVVRKMPAPKGEKEYKKAVREVAVAVSNQLGNTPVIALQSYIDPMVFAKWRQA